jgi:hypothetical protein
VIVFEVAATLAVAVGLGILLLAYRDHERVHLPEQLAAFLAMLVGIGFALSFELLEFILDWVFNTDLQPTNTNTITDLVLCDVAAVFGAVLATRLYCRYIDAARRERLGDLAFWLADGPNNLIDKHGLALALAFTVIVGTAVAGLWFAGRPVPGFPIG